jgi:hypothetical protein
MPFHGPSCVNLTEGTKTKTGLSSCHRRRTTTTKTASVRTDWKILSWSPRWTDCHQSQSNLILNLYISTLKREEYNPPKRLYSPTTNKVTILIITDVETSNLNMRSILAKIWKKLILAWLQSVTFTIIWAWYSTSSISLLVLLSGEFNPCFNQKFKVLEKLV